MSVRYTNLDGLGNVDEFAAREIGEFMAEKLNEFLGRGSLQNSTMVLYMHAIERLTGATLSFAMSDSIYDAGTPLLDGEPIIP